ncbi:ATP-binding cassette domain-containing protein [archaeon]|nr:ATP-binding cassette domain-containing protein [archaeon]
MYVIETKELVKTFGEFTAVDGVNLTVEKGMIFGLLGPNGAGKSTLINILTCALRPTSGTALISGLDVAGDRKDVLSIIGVVPQEKSFYEDLTVMENLIYFGSLYSMPRVEIKRKAHEILNLLRLLDKKDKKSKDLSGGMKTRLNVACALIHKPEVLILDEPSVGLDPVSAMALRETIKKVNSDGVTVLITTHDMMEADELCHRIVIVNRGKIVEEGTPGELKAKVGVEKILIKSTPGEYHALAEKIEKIASVEETEDALTISSSDFQSILPKVLEIFREANETVVDITASKPNLKDVFIHATGEEWK